MSDTDFVEVVTTPFGRFQIDRRDIIGSTLKAGTLWDGPGFLQPIAIEYGRLGEVGTTILDVGANLGSFSVWLASRGAWRVVAVEPVPETMQRLKANLDLNREVTADRVIPLQIAAYDRDCRMDLAGPLDPGSPGSISLVVQPDGPIQAQPLDDYQFLCGQRVSLIKIDAQGCDGLIVRGLYTTIKRHHPVIVFEWEAGLAGAHGDTLEMTLLWFQGMGYSVFPWPAYANNYLALPHVDRAPYKEQTL